MLAKDFVLIPLQIFFTKGPILRESSGTSTVVLAEVVELLAPAIEALLM